MSEQYSLPFATERLHSLSYHIERNTNELEKLPKHAEDEHGNGSVTDTIDGSSEQRRQ
jgi:hypothetical protein